jgi:hypothetical protein
VRRYDVRSLDTNNPGTLHNRRFGHDARAHGLDLLGLRFLGFPGFLGFLDGWHLVFFGRFALGFGFGGRLGDRNFRLGLSGGLDYLYRRLVNLYNFVGRFGRGLVNFGIRRFGDDGLGLGDRFFCGRLFFGGGLLALAFYLFGLFVGRDDVHVLSGLHGASACGSLAEPLRDSLSQTGFDRGHVVLDLYALGPAFFQNDLAGNAEFLG